MVARIRKCPVLGRHPSLWQLFSTSSSRSVRFSQLSLSGVQTNKQGAQYRRGRHAFDLWVRGEKMKHQPVFWPLDGLSGVIRYWFGTMWHTTQFFPSTYARFSSSRFCQLPVSFTVGLLVVFACQLISTMGQVSSMPQVPFGSCSLISRVLGVQWQFLSDFFAPLHLKRPGSTLQLCWQHLSDCWLRFCQQRPWLPFSSRCHSP